MIGLTKAEVARLVAKGIMAFPKKHPVIKRPAMPRDAYMRLYRDGKRLRGNSPNSAYHHGKESFA